MAFRSSRVRLSLIALALLLLVPGLLPAQEEPRWTPLGPWGGTVVSIAVHPTDPQVLYAGGSLAGVVKSTDGGTSWRLLPGSPFVPAFVALDPRRPTTVYASQRSARQVFKSTDGGIHWRLINAGLPRDLDISGLAVDPLRPSRLYLSSQNRGVWRSVDGGASWQRASQGLPALASGPGTFYAVEFSQPRLWRSTDSGLTWRPLPLPEGQFFFLRADPLDPNTLYTAARNGFEWRIHRSTDGGLSWASLVPPPANCGLSDLTVARPSASSPAVLYLAGCADNQSALFRGSDGGASWTDVSAGLPGEFVSAVTVDPQDSRVVYAGIGGRALEGVDRGVWKSTDSGATWQLSGLRRLPILALAASPVPGVLWASTLEEGSVYRSGDAGATWQNGSGGQVLWQVRDFAFDPSDPERVYIAGFGGVWVTTE